LTLFARFGLCPCEGGTPELSGVFGGAPSFAPLCHARRQQPNLRPQCQDQGILFIM
jgi:hypothetical protein